MSPLFVASSARCSVSVNCSDPPTVSMWQWSTLKWCISALSAWVLLVGHWEERTVLCQLLGQAQQSGFAVVCVLSAPGKQASFCCVPSQEGYRSEHFCFMLLNDAQIRVVGFNKASRKQKLWNIRLFLICEIGLSCFVHELLTWTPCLLHCTSSCSHTVPPLPSCSGTSVFPSACTVGLSTASPFPLCAQDIFIV